MYVHTILLQKNAWVQLINVLFIFVLFPFSWIANRQISILALSIKVFRKIVQSVDDLCMVVFTNGKGWILMDLGKLVFNTRKIDFFFCLPTFNLTKSTRCDFPARRAEDPQNIASEIALVLKSSSLLWWNQDDLVHCMFAMHSIAISKTMFHVS